MQIYMNEYLIEGSNSELYIALIFCRKYSMELYLRDQGRI